MISLGIDEVGRGSWAGPMVVGAVILSKPIAGLKDSKLLSASKRLFYYQKITGEAVAYSLGWVSQEEIDNLGMSGALALATKRAIGLIKVDYDEIIIDGSFNFLSDNSKARAEVKADQNVMCVSAASVIAKVARDKYMQAMAIQYPVYGFDKHVGYGTTLHLRQLKIHGVCSLHRLSFKPVKLIAAGGTS